MRGTIIGVFSVVVVIVSALAFTAMRATLGNVSNKGVSQRAVRSAVAQLQVEGLRIERWLSEQSAASSLAEPFEKGSVGARADAATSTANTLQEQAKRDPAFSALRPTLIVIFDKDGVVLGRDRSRLMRGDKLGERHPDLVKTVRAGHTGSDVWVNKTHNEHMLASYAPIRNEAGNIVGGIAVGTAFNNQRLQRTSDATSRLPLIAAVPEGDTLRTVAESESAPAELLATATKSTHALNTKQIVALRGLPDTWDSAGGALFGYGDGKQAVIMSANKTQVIGSAAQLFWPAFGVLALGLILAVVGAHLIDNYISQPVSDLEDGLLAVINGQTDLRFELEHKLLGGLVFRINSLLNQLLGVREDDTDALGRPSVAPSGLFGAPLNVDERMASLSPSETGGDALQAEGSKEYYKRSFDEYTKAKKAIGDDIDDIDFAGFVKRMQSHEKEMGDKHGKRFRFNIESKGKEIVFIAVPLT